jgi:hypothetical protein
MVEVHLLALPVQIASRAQQHFDELLREFALMQGGEDDPGEGEHRPVPQRLLDIVDGLTKQFAGVNDAARERLEAAVLRGDRVIEDHVLELPPEAAPGSQALGDILDEADDYCRQGEHLLTLETPPDCLAYRRWYLSEVIDQLGGAAPTPWPESAHRTG